MWTVLATEEFDHWLIEQDAKAQEAARFAVRLLMQTGPLLGRPYADTLKGSRFGNMKELRVNGSRMAIRIAFAFDPKRRAILLAAGDKRGVSETLFYRKLIVKADALFEKYLESR